MRKFVNKIMGAVALVFGGVLALAGCAKQSHYVVNCEGHLYAKLSQTVELELEEGKFDSSISTKDFKLSDSFSGKSITNVKYVDEKNIQLTFDGTLASYEESDNYFYYKMEITGGMGHDTAEALVTVYMHAPRVYTTSYMSSSVLYSSTFVLPYGEWSSDASGITLNGEGTLTASVANGSLSISVKDYKATATEEYPVVTIPASMSSFNKELSVEIGKSVSKDLA